MVAAVRSIEKWQELGHQLNINPEMLSNLFKSGRSGAECRDEMMTYWEKHDNDASWEKLARALMRMGENQLAETIINEHARGMITSPTQYQQQPPIASTESSKSKLRVTRVSMLLVLLLNGKNEGTSLMMPSWNAVLSV